MKKLGIILGLAILVLAIMAIWQVASDKLANVELRDDLQDLASQAGTRIGFATPLSDEDYRNAVIRNAEGHGIELRPDQVMVQRTGSGKETKIWLAVGYTVPVRMPGFSFTLHFSASSGERP